MALVNAKQIDSIVIYNLSIPCLRGIARKPALLESNVMVAQQKRRTRRTNRINKRTNS